MKDGGPASSTGATLRDLFAASALPAMVAKFSDPDGGWDPEQVADNAYYLADKMLAAREKESS